MVFSNYILSVIIFEKNYIRFFSVFYFRTSQVKKYLKVTTEFQIDIKDNL